MKNVLPLAWLISLLISPQASAENSTEKPGAPVLAPSDNLVVEGVPSPPLSLVEDADRYT